MLKGKAALVIKTGIVGYSQTDSYQIIKRMKILVDPKISPNIYILHGNLTDEQMNSVYNHPKIKTFITLTHGEGYGRPIAQFAITGKPIIAPR